MEDKIMGLITKEIDVCIVSNNYKHYEDLGYCIPKEINKNGKEIIKNGTYIKVKVCDLPKNSHYNVDVECDRCGDKLTVRYEQYLNNINTRGIIMFAKVFYYARVFILWIFRMLSCMNCEHV